MRGSPEDRLTILKNAQILTMNDRRETFLGDIAIEDGLITGVGRFDTSLSNVVQLDGRIICPGFIQTHVHLCRTLFRGVPALQGAGAAKALAALEAALNAETTHLAAMTGGMELIACGTTTFLSVEPARHLDAVFEAVRALGLRGLITRSILEDGESLPPPLREKPLQAIQDCIRLMKAWEGKEDGRIRFGVALSQPSAAGDSAFRKAAAFAREQMIPVVAQDPEEKARSGGAAESEPGMLSALLEAGVPARQIHRVHGSRMDEGEMDKLAGESIHLTHCPTSSLTRGMGLSMVTEMVRRGVPVTLGADGVPWTDTLDLFGEMRLAFSLQVLRKGVAQALDPEDILRMVTIEGAKALGREHEIGTIEVGKRADLVVIKPNTFNAGFVVDPAAAIVRSCTPANVETVLINGDFVFRNNRFFGISREEIAEKAASAFPKILTLAEQYGLPPQRILS